MIIIEDGEALEIVSDATAVTTEPSWQVGLVAAQGSVFMQASSEAGACNGTTAVAMVSGAASTQKRISGLSVYNRDTVSRTIIIRRSATLPIIKATMVAGSSLVYESGAGWAYYAL